MSAALDPFAQQRNLANLRSIVRSDPSVLEILETSVYSTIYHYLTPDGGGEGEWVKQKAEGPMFIVRRNTQPEYALFMLNRQTVKNVTIPLIKGEMKAKDVGEGMLQVARRGEKVRRGIWFSELEVVQRFQAEITRICGPPSQRPDSTNPTSNSPALPPPIPQPALHVPASGGPSGAGGADADGFSRLFAGLMTTPSAFTSSASETPQPPSFPQAIFPAQQSVATYSPVPVPAQLQRSHPAATASSSGINLASSSAAPSHSSPRDLSAPPTPESAPSIIYDTHPPPSNPFTPPPGQTVDDLLNSILGIGIAPAIPPPQMARANVLEPAQLPPPANGGFIAPLPAPPVPHDTKYEALNTMLATDAMTADDIVRGLTGGPPGDAGRDGRSASGMDPAPHHQARNHRQAHASNGLPSPASHAGYLAPSPHGHTQLQPCTPPVDQRGASSHPSAPVDRDAAALNGSFIDALGGVPDLRPAGRAGFQQVILGLIQNEPRFVDDLWAGYLRRLAGG